MKTEITLIENPTVYVEVILPLHVDGYYTYEVPEELIEKVKAGKRVVIPLGERRFYTGIIAEVHTRKPSHPKIKSILDVIDESPVLTEKLLQFWEWVKSYYMCFPGDIMQAAVPQTQRVSSETKVVLNKKFDFSESKLNEKELALTNALSNGNALTFNDISKLIEVKNPHKIIKSLLDRSIITSEEELKKGFQVKKEKKVRLNPSFEEDEQLNALIAKSEKKAPKQVDLIMAYLMTKGDDFWITKKQLLAKAEVSNAVLTTLIEKKVFIESTEEQKPQKSLEEITSITLSSEQEIAYLQLQSTFETKEICLLHGITGSGKTAIYIKCIQNILKEGKQALYLLPEIALTFQVIQRIKSYFQEEVGVYHSRMTDRERAETWQWIQEGKYKVVVGARSSLFLPFSNLGIIVVDEEHEPSFKQTDSTPFYHGRDAAIILGKIMGCKVILGSATPSVESYFNAKNGKFGLVSLNIRFGESILPEVFTINMAQKTDVIPNTVFSIELFDQIKTTLEQGKQVILFQNRRGFAPITHCTLCGWKPECVQCDIKLTYHKKKHLLSCHYCGYSEFPASACPDCGNTNIQVIGFGTERLVEDLRLLLPEYTIERLDLDTTKSKRAFDTLITDFSVNKINVLIGTQMVTKGLDFEGVTLVGIIDADKIMAFPDFRSVERAFQQIEQVAGRAGRRKAQGKVLIQTRQPKHPLFNWVRNHNYDSFYQTEIVSRKEYRYPPFSKLIRFTLKHVSKDTVFEAASDLQKRISSRIKNDVLGPVEPSINRIRNLYLYEILIKLDPKVVSISLVKQFISTCIAETKQQKPYKSVVIFTDVDCY